ncbi:AUX/IAA transcriptional regulator family protein, putative isoform 2 [Hibiscus syriacus]|uniref:Auxin-responsive protein n=1 Tax=Hibiscus syriacus TaxID=106335 RepID=A0A6A3ABU1_HIBSY|nr:auxin-responsive protein IAA20-like [Hibiscus syriacus]KAE8701568.1 AUX/IAA transcriptional regulator family protein, putative isoform 2 [Hibiscus syriacus]
MELHLGLSLPTNPFLPIGYELKQCPFDAHVTDGDGGCCSSGSSSSSGGIKRTCFDDGSETRVVPKTLPLLLWNSDQPNEEDDPNDLHENSSSSSSSSSIIKNDGEGLVGWPPVKTWRKKLRRHVHSGRPNNNRMVAAKMTARKSVSTYVKVKMEGNAIARKIDISVHRSFESLTTTLMRMFDIRDEHLQKSFKLAYQDREGDWLLAEDVPWRTFIRCLKCIKLIRIGC